MRHFVVRSVTPHHVSTDKRQNMGEKQKESLVTDTHTQKKPSAHDNISDPGNDLHITIFFCPSIDSSVVAGTEPQRELIEIDAVSDSRSVYALKYIYIFLSVCLKCVRAESVLQSKLLPFSSLSHRGCHVDHHGLSKHELVCK